MGANIPLSLGSKSSAFELSGNAFFLNFFVKIDTCLYGLLQNSRNQIKLIIGHFSKPRDEGGAHLSVEDLEQFRF